MAVKNIRQRVVAFIAGILLGPAIVWAGLETGTYISDLVVANPLSSDLASTADDHIRLLKSTIKTTFPNINGAVTATDEQLNSIPSGFAAANPTGTIGLTAVNGSAATYLRSDGAPALSQAIAPTWTASHTFSKTYAAGASAVQLSSASPSFLLKETDGAANNQIWIWTAGSEQLQLLTANDAEGAFGTAMTVDRTGTTVDTVSFPTDGASGPNFLVGPTNGISTQQALIRTAQSRIALRVQSPAAGNSTLLVHNEATALDNVFVSFGTEATFTARGSIDYNRAGGAVRYNTTSDARLKKNFKESPSASGVINCIKVESYDWKESGYHVDHGFVAQRLNKCAPYAVKSSDDPSVIWAVDPSKLVPALIKYVQEQDARIQRLEADAKSRH